MLGNLESNFPAHPLTYVLALYTYMCIIWAPIGRAHNCCFFVVLHTEVCMYINVHTHIHIYTHTYIHTCFI